MLDPPSPEDEESIMIALKQSDRVVSISLTVTNSLLEKLSAITEPFAELEQLVLLSQDNLQLTLPGLFRWGPRLRTLRSTRVVIPTLPQLPSQSTNFIHLQLHEIPNVGYFLPDAFANVLSEMTQLETLSLHPLYPTECFHPTCIANIVQTVELAVILHSLDPRQVFPFLIQGRKSKDQYV
jgi:hypothetical protein